MFKKAKENNKCFTLAELLIVVAIIAVLVAISIPIFTSQLEKSREAVDMANLRSAYAECAAEVLTVDTATYTSVYKKVDPQQTTAGWASAKPESIGTVATANIPDTIVKGTPFYVVVKADGTAEITETKPTDAKAKELK